MTTRDNTLPIILRYSTPLSGGPVCLTSHSERNQHRSQGDCRRGFRVRPDSTLCTKVDQETTDDD
jgi:hypothetical protein